MILEPTSMIKLYLLDHFFLFGIYISNRNLLSCNGYTSIVFRSRISKQNYIQRGDDMGQLLHVLILLPNGFQTLMKPIIKKKYTQLSSSKTCDDDPIPVTCSFKAWSLFVTRYDSKASESALSVGNYIFSIMGCLPFSRVRSHTC